MEKIKRVYSIESRLHNIIPFLLLPRMKIISNRLLSREKGNVLKALNPWKNRLLARRVQAHDRQCIAIFF